MKHSILWAALAAAFLSFGAAAQTTNNDSNANSSSGAVSGSNSNSYGNVGNATTNIIAPSSNPNANATSSSSTQSRSNATNAGNTQVIEFNTPTPATTTANVHYSGGATNTNLNVNSGTATQNQVLSGGTNSTLTTNGTQTMNQNVTTSGTTTQNLNTTTSSVISGEQTQHVEYSGTQTIRNVPSVNGPPLTTSNDTCMGSSSGSLNVPGIGIGLGTTWTDRNCVMLKNAREMWNMGMKAAAMALFCTDTNNRTALELTGFTCPQTAAAQRSAAAQSEEQALAAERRALVEEQALATERQAVAKERQALAALRATAGATAVGTAVVATQGAGGPPNPYFVAGTPATVQTRADVVVTPVREGTVTSSAQLKATALTAGKDLESVQPVMLQTQAKAPAPELKHPAVGDVLEDGSVTVRVLDAVVQEKK